jgi:hypothetical protein
MTFNVQQENVPECMILNVCDGYGRKESKAGWERRFLRRDYNVESVGSRP